MLYLSVDNTIIDGKNSFEVSVRYSPSVIMKNSDTHHFREFTDVGTHSDSSMYGYSFDYKYDMGPKYNLGVGYTYAKYSETRGDTKRTYFDGETAQYNQSSAMKSKESSLKFYLQYKL